MRAIVLLASACLCMGATEASAADWSLRSMLSNTVEFNDNQFLSPKSPGNAVASYSTITGNAEARTPTSKFDFDSYFNYRKYGGPGSDALPQTENQAYGFTSHYETYGKNSRDRNFLDAGYNSQSSAFALLNQLGIVANTPGNINQFNARGGIDRALTSQDTISLSAQSSRTFYDPSGAGTAFDDTSATGSWQHRLNSRVSVSATSQAEWLSYNNALNSSVLILRNQAGIDVTLSPLLYFRGSAGAAYVSVENGVNSLTGIGGSAPTTGQSSSNLGFITDMLLTYKALKSTTFNLSATQTIGPTIVGSLFQIATLRADVTQTINATSSMTFAADFSRSTSTNTTDFASASVSYSRQFTREWMAQLSYRHLHRFASSGTAVSDPITGTPILSGTGPADSNSFLVVISKSVTILPPGN